MFPFSSWSTLSILAGLALALVALGAGLTLGLGVMRAMLWCLSLCSRLCQRLWAWLWETPLDSHGSARFATAADVQRAGFYAHPEHLPLAQFDGKTLYEPVGGSVALIAPPRSHKSWGVLMPAIRAFRGSCIVHDPRGELYEHTHEARQSHGPVLRFAPTEKVSAALDPLALIRWQEDRQHGDLRRVSQALLSPEPGAVWSEFALEAVPLLPALLIERYEAGAHGLGAVVRFLVDPQTTLKAKFEALLTHPHPTVAQAARRMLDKSETRQGAVVQHLLQSLNVFTDPLIDQNTSANDLDLMECVQGARPVTVYWCAEFSDARRLRPLFGCLLEQLLARFGSPGKKRHKVLLALAEAMALGYSPELESGMSHFAGDGIQVLLAFQNAAQCARVYGPHSPLLHSIPTSLYYTPVNTDLDTREEISQILGTTTTAYATRSQRVSVFGILESETLGTQRLERRLMTSDEVARLDEEACILTTKAHPPVMCRKLDALPLPVLTLPQRYRRVGAAAGAVALLLLSFWTVSHFAGSGTTPPPTLALTTQEQGGGISAPHQAESMTPAPPPTAVARWRVYKSVSGSGVLPSVKPEMFLPAYPTQEDCESARRFVLDNHHASIAAQPPGQVRVKRIDEGRVVTTGSREQTETWLCASDESPPS